LGECALQSNNGPPPRVCSNGALASRVFSPNTLGGAHVSTRERNTGAAHQHQHQVKLDYFLDDALTEAKYICDVGQSVHNERTALETEQRARTPNREGTRAARTTTKASGRGIPTQICSIGLRPEHGVIGISTANTATKRNTATSIRVSRKQRTRVRRCPGYY
jgi:hypothetical protein